MFLDFRHLLPVQFTDAVIQTLSSLDIESCINIGHSFGTSCCGNFLHIRCCSFLHVAWMDTLQDCIKVKGRVLVDPICFQLWSHHLAFNAVSKWPPTCIHELILSIVAMREPGIGTFLRRYFVWYVNCLDCTCS